MQHQLVATALTVYGIETLRKLVSKLPWICYGVATALTVYGIETRSWDECKEYTQLQQRLPFTVLKLNFEDLPSVSSLQRCNSAYRLRY